MRLLREMSLEIIASDDNFGTSLTWTPSTGVSTIYFDGTSPSLGVYLVNPAVQNESTSTAGTGYSGSKDWGTIAVEVAAS